MGRTSKYSDNLLLDAVIQYSDLSKGKIKLIELAAWARENIVGLEGVRDYHFVRLVKNPQTGKMEKRPCTQRLEELNAVRDIRERENTNMIVSSVDINSFYQLSEREQRKTIEGARLIVAEYRSSNTYLRRMNKYLEVLSGELNKRLSDYETMIQQIKQHQMELDAKLSSMSRVLEDRQMRAIADEMGITEGFFDSVKYKESLTLEQSQITNIDREIRAYMAKLASENEKKEEPDDEIQKVMDELTEF